MILHEDDFESGDLEDYESPKPELKSIGRIIVERAVYDSPVINRSFFDLMTTSVEINQFYKVAELWMPKFVLN